MIPRAPRMGDPISTDAQAADIHVYGSAISSYTGNPEGSLRYQEIPWDAYPSKAQG